MNKLDPVESPLAWETVSLCDILDLLRHRVDLNHMRLTTGMRIMDLVFDLQEQVIAERKLQLQQHGKN